MKINTHQLPKTGDYYAFQVTVWHEEKLKFTLVKKLSGTELSIALNRKCAKDLNDALEKLKEFAVSEAKSIFSTQEYKEGGVYTGDFSPCW